jgi:hypothetical protein
LFPPASTSLLASLSQELVSARRQRGGGRTDEATAAAAIAFSWIILRAASLRRSCAQRDSSVAESKARGRRRSRRRLYQSRCVLFGLDVKGDTGTSKSAPPRNEIEAALARTLAILHVRGNAEGDVVGAALAQHHGVVARAAGIGADDEAAADDLAGLAVARDDVLAPWQMHAVGAQRARPGIGLMSAAPLRRASR